MDAAQLFSFWRMASFSRATDAAVFVRAYDLLLTLIGYLAYSPDLNAGKRWELRRAPRYGPTNSSNNDKERGKPDQNDAAGGKAFKKLKDVKEGLTSIKVAKPAQELQTSQKPLGVSLNDDGVDEEQDPLTKGHQDAGGARGTPARRGQRVISKEKCGRMSLNDIAGSGKPKKEEESILSPFSNRPRRKK
ncbi:hypothetical protein PG996_008589 [Apiospora saccharicola]|uniref:Uncharacterized protein n=1 Tax=Apiospora saccharicola TaxID=335842 RepID=A0ABR1UZ08_9PEZI